MKIIGLTGGIGSGKTTVLRLFESLGAAVYIADVEAKNLMNSDAELIQQIKKVFGEKAYLEGILNKEHIASIVFNEKEKLAVLNSLVHPKVRTHFQNFVKASKAKIIIYEAAILFESGSNSFCDYVITVTANYEDKIERIRKRDNTSKEQIEARMRNQSNDIDKINKSHFVVKNNSLEATKTQVKTIFEVLLRQVDIADNLNKALN